MSHCILFQIGSRVSPLNKLTQGVYTFIPNASFRSIRVSWPLDHDPGSLSDKVLYLNLRCFRFLACIGWWCIQLCNEGSTRIFVCLDLLRARDLKTKRVVIECWLSCLVVTNGCCIVSRFGKVLSFVRKVKSVRVCWGNIFQFVAILCCLDPFQTASYLTLQKHICILRFNLLS